MKNYLVGINFADSIQADSEEEAKTKFWELYEIDREWLFAEKQEDSE